MDTLIPDDKSPEDDTSIRLKHRTRAALKARKRGGESYDAVVLRLIRDAEDAGPQVGTSSEINAGP